MTLPAVELDDLARARPVAVDLEAPVSEDDPIVEAGEGEAMTVEEGREALLKTAALAPRGLFLQALQRRLYLADASASGVSLDQVLEREPVLEPAVFRLSIVDRTLVCKPRRVAADQWLSTAASPLANTAASHRPSRWAWAGR